MEKTGRLVRPQARKMPTQPPPPGMPTPPPPLMRESKQAATVGPDAIGRNVRILVSGWTLIEGTVGTIVGVEGSGDNFQRPGTPSWSGEPGGRSGFSPRSKSGAPDEGVTKIERLCEQKDITLRQKPFHHDLSTTKISIFQSIHQSNPQYSSQTFFSPAYPVKVTVKMSDSNKHSMGKSDAARIQSAQAKGGKDMSSSGFAARAQSAADRNNNASQKSGSNADVSKGNTSGQNQKDGK